MSGTSIIAKFSMSLKRIGQEPSGGSNCKVTGNKCFYNALLLDKFKQWESSQ